MLVHGVNLIGFSWQDLGCVPLPLNLSVLDAAAPNNPVDWVSTNAVATTMGL